MLTPLLLYRCITFALFVICNAVICTVAAWNMSIVEDVGRIFQVDIYLIFLGALGVVFIFPIVFVDIARRNALTSRVWFELSWLTVFCMMEFAGAVAVSAIMPHSLCGATVVRAFSAPCTSTNVLLSFCWLCSIVVLSYLLILLASSLLHKKDDNQIWRSGVRDFPWFETQQCLRSLPSSPVIPRFHRKPLSLVAPKPRRPPPLFVQNGLGSKYEIEHYAAPENLTNPPLPPAQDHRVSPTRDQRQLHVATLYPQHVQSSLPAVSSHMLQQQGPSPPPLGNWPRLISSQHPSISRQRPPLPLDNSGVRDNGVHVPAPHRPRPSGPRTRTSSSTFSRPLPSFLDLTDAKMSEDVP